MASEAAMSSQSLRVTVVMVVVTAMMVGTEGASPPPHMVVIMADDLGWNDVGYRDPEMVTPNIDHLKAEGVELTNSYMMPVCTPSRAAFLTGVYPFRMGLQHSVLTGIKNRSLPLEYRVLPQRLQELGYATHLVGKWHLGFCHPDMTPTRRGFDTFYGMYLGKSGYYNHIASRNGYDLHSNVGPDPQNWQVMWGDNMTYSTHLFTKRAVDIIDSHDESQPLFLKLNYQAVHGPLEVPQFYVDNYCSDVTTGPERKLHCAMTAAMDEGIGNVTQALARLGDNVLIVFVSDNGGPVKLGSSNWPLRGAKITLWEGGTKAVTILHSKALLPDAPYEWDGLMHAVDWYPTLVHAARGRNDQITGIDGLDIWNRIVRQGWTLRKEFIYNINDVKETAAIRMGSYKLYQNPKNPDGWYNPPAGIEAPEEPTGKYPEYLLFDLENDPTETKDLSAEMQDKVEELKARLNEFRSGVLNTTEAVSVPEGKPKYHGGAWVSGWCSID